MRYLIPLLFSLPLLAQDAEEDRIKVEREWRGGRTDITAAEFHRVMDQDAWTKLWERHAGKKERAPEVNFEKFMVVACFLGPVTYDHVGFYAAKKTKEEIVFGLLVDEEDCCDFSAQPQYYMAVIPRSKMKLTIISRVKQELDVDVKKDKLLKEIPEIPE